MKLRAIYTNNPERFPRIEFNDGLNVVFARVKDFSLANRDSHNLGKTFLIRVLDFTLLSGIDKKHPFRVRRDAFGDFVFFLEVETEQGKFITIRRAVNGSRTICINLAEIRGQDFSDLPEESWAHSKLGLDKAKKILDQLLRLSSIVPFDFRKGLGYFLRRQSDYDNEFMISRFGRGKDRDWKPFMALLLGFDHELVARKYDLDHREEEIKTVLREIARRSRGESGEYDELKGVVELKQAEIEALRGRVNAFDFLEVESDITKETVSSVESRIADLNERRYELEQESSEIDKALLTHFGFDIDAIRGVFQEADVVLPGLLVRQYEDLVQFNERLSSGRKERLGIRRAHLVEEQKVIQVELERLNKKRVAALEIVTQRKTLKKFRDFQAMLLREEEELVNLRQELARLDQVTEQKHRLRRIQEERLQLVDEVESMVRKGSPFYTSVRACFADFARSILFAPAVLSSSVNSAGNLEFRTRVLESRASRKETDEGEGTSYKKVLCACFDLALLASRSQQGFYRFAYHDGIFEGLDNRRKVSLLDTVRRTCDENELQYILTVIDADLPRDDKDNKLLFREGEIVRELHDDGDSGRLFRMPSF